MEVSTLFFALGLALAICATIGWPKVSINLHAAATACLIAALWLVGHVMHR